VGWIAWFAAPAAPGGAPAGGEVPPPPPGARGRKLLWRYARALSAPVLLWVLVAFALRAPVWNWLRGEDTYDQAVLQEWLEEARGFRETLPEMVASYLERGRRLAALRAPADARGRGRARAPGPRAGPGGAERRRPAGGDPGAPAGLG
jgi:hypothetical protein